MISVIVPVYNVEKYIDECVESLINQTHKEFEVVLVDDGSTDSSGQKCDKWAEKDSRIKVIHKPNGGLRDAWICGCNNSNGDHIMFLDGDDYLKINSIEVLNDAIARYNADCIQFEYTYITDGKAETRTKNHFEIMSGDELREKALYNWFKTSINDSQWDYGRTTKLYSAELIKKIIPVIDKKISVAEDFEMSLWLVLFCQKYVVLEGQYLYCWRFVDNSMSRNVSQEYIDKHLYFFSLIEKFAVSNNIPHDSIDIIIDNIWAQVTIATISRKISFQNKYHYLKIIKSHYYKDSNIFHLADKYSTFTKYSLKYIARIGCFVPCLLSQIYLMIKK